MSKRRPDPWFDLGEPVLFVPSPGDMDSENDPRAAVVVNVEQHGDAPRSYDLQVFRGSRETTDSEPEAIYRVNDVPVYLVVKGYVPWGVRKVGKRVNS